MWLVVGVLHLFLGLDVALAKGAHFNVQCFSNHCGPEEICKVSSTNGQTTGWCVRLEHHAHLTYGCPQTLTDGQMCYCDTTDCVNAVNVNPVVQKAGGLQCNGHQCPDNQACNYALAGKDRDMHIRCGHIEHHAVVCTAVPVEHQPCFCRTDECNTRMYNLIYQTNHVQQTSNEFLCGDHICHPDQKCKIEERDDGHLHLKCEAHHLNHFQHCLPNLLSRGSACICDNRACVDQTLISLFTGHEVTGLICSDHDDHVCHANEKCVIRHEFNSHFRKHCGHVGQLQECTSLPDVGHSCYCTTQECVYGKYAATTALPTTALPTTALPTTAMPTTAVPTDAVTGGTDLTTALPTVAGTTMQNMASTTMGEIKTTVGIVVVNTTEETMNTTMSVTNVTEGVVVPCTDVEDEHFSCVVYAMQFSICKATSGTLYDIANKRCRKYCGICGGDGTPTAPAASAGPVTVKCVDHDNRCSLFKEQICGSKVSEGYVISTCAKTCNKCTEYIASLQAQVPKKRCVVCGDADQMTPCSPTDIINSNLTTVLDCPPDYDYCMTDMFVDANSNTDVYKRCVKKETCDLQWLKESATKSYCTNFGQVALSNAYECHFCCEGNTCNRDIKPADNTLVTAITRK